MCNLLASAFMILSMALGLRGFSAIAADDESPVLKTAPVRDTSPVAAQADKPNGQSAGNGGQSAYERIMRELDQPTEMDFVETTLIDVVEALKIRHRIEIQLDSKALTDAGVNADMPITRTVKGVSLRSALRLMLREHELTFVLHNEVLVITTQEGSTELRQYDVADFVRNGWTIGELAEAVRFALPRPAPGAQADGPRGSASTGFDLPGQSARRGVRGPAVAYQAPAVAQPSAESEVMPVRSSLLVRTTDRGHMDVSNLLAELRHRMETKTD